MKKILLIFMIIPLLLFSALPVGAAEKEVRKWQDERIYYITVDRFNNGDSSNDFDVDTNNPVAYHGGDFQGIIDQLDYLQEMGFTTINLSPIFNNEKKDFQSYWIEDFYETDEHYGTMKSFKELVKEVHKRDMRIILDFVTNNVGKNHSWLNDAEKKDWFHKQKEIGVSRSQKDIENGWVNGLPDLNQDQPEVKKYLIDCAKWWIQETNIDGYRLDKMNYVPLIFWNDFVKEIKAVKDNFYILGDVHSEDLNYIRSYQEIGIDGLLDYPLNGTLRDAFAKPDQSLEKLLEMKEELVSTYKDPMLMGTFLDTHETERFTREAVNHNEHPGPRWKLALTFLYTSPGIPVVFYGSEIALDGGEGIDSQRQMDFRTDKELIDYIAKLVEVRGQLPSLSRGTFEVLYAKDGMGVYKREYQGETAIIALNNSSKSQKITLTEEDLVQNKELRGLLEGDLVKSKNNQYNIILDRDHTEVYVLAEKSGLNYPYLIALGLVYALFIIFIILIWKRSKRNRATE